MQQGLHSREQFRGAEWFGDVLVGPRFERGLSLRLARASGQHDDRQVRPGAYAAYQLNSIPIGQPQIDDGEVRSMRFSLTDREIAGIGRDNPHTVGFGKKAQDILNPLIVLDDEYDAHRASLSNAPLRAAHRLPLASPRAA